MVGRAVSVGAPDGTAVMVGRAVSVGAPDGTDEMLGSLVGWQIVSS